jgi:hypothetical protein
MSIPDVTVPFWSYRLFDSSADADAFIRFREKADGVAVKDCHHLLKTEDEIYAVALRRLFASRGHTVPSVTRVLIRGRFYSKAAEMEMSFFIDSICKLTGVLTGELNYVAAAKAEAKAGFSKCKKCHSLLNEVTARSMFRISVCLVCGIPREIDDCKSVDPGDCQFVSCVSCHSVLNLTEFEKLQPRAIGVCPVCDTGWYDGKVVISEDEWKDITGCCHQSVGRDLTRKRSLFKANYSEKVDRRVIEVQACVNNMKRRKQGLLFMVYYRFFLIPMNRP